MSSVSKAPRRAHGLKTRATCAALLVLLTSVHLSAQTTTPALLQDVGIDQNLGAQVSPDLVFCDEAGREVKLEQYFASDRPIVLALVYYRCPMLCTMVLNDLTRAMNAMPTSAGEQFDVLTVSFDPGETPDLAAAKKRAYLKQYRRASAEAGWHFLTGEQQSIRALTDVVGFRFAYDTNTQQYAHASGLIVLSPRGKVSRYFYGVEYSARDLRLALAEAAEGKVSSASEKVLLYCFQYDPSTGKYSLAVTRLIRAGAVVTLLLLGGGIALFLRRERARTSALLQRPFTTNCGRDGGSTTA
jgi:protein SCO1/2